MEHHSHAMYAINGIPAASTLINDINDNNQYYLAQGPRPFTLCNQHAEIKKGTKIKNT